MESGFSQGYKYSTNDLQTLPVQEYRGRYYITLTANRYLKTVEVFSQNVDKQSIFALVRFRAPSGNAPLLRIGSDKTRISLSAKDGTILKSSRSESMLPYEDGVGKVIQDKWFVCRLKMTYWLNQARIGVLGSATYANKSLNFSQFLDTNTYSPLQTECSYIGIGLNGEPIDYEIDVMELLYYREYITSGTEVDITSYFVNKYNNIIDEC